MRRLVLDLEDVLSAARSQSERCLYEHLCEKVDLYRQQGFEIILSSSAGTPESYGNTKKIGARHLLEVLQQLKELTFVYDEIIFGRPFAGESCLILDDKAITPAEFLSNSCSQIVSLIDERVALEAK